MSNRKAIKSDFGQDIFFDWNNTTKYTTVGDKIEFRETPEEYDGQTFLIRESHSNYDKQKNWNNLPLLTQGFSEDRNWKNQGAEKLQPGCLVVHATMGGSYGASGVYRRAVITEIKPIIKKVKMVNGKMTAEVFNYIFIRSINKDNSLGSVFEFYRADSVRVETDGELDVKTYSKSFYKITKEYEQLCRDKANVKRLIDIKMSSKAPAKRRSI